ncbi:MAG TPA: hypothetical protein VGV69_00820 [Solirubrobacterales bacterium]|nr:hypothetical protein [Solirubrobacterales bacterium]
MSFRITKMRRFHESAFKHGISAADIEHVLRQPMRLIVREDGSRLYLGPGRNAELLEVITVLQADRSEVAIHAMKIRPGYANLLPRE